MREMLDINLKDIYIREFSFSFNYKITEELRSKLNETLKPDEEGDYVFFDSYKVKGIGHIAIAVVSKERGEDENYKILCRCYLGKGGRLRKDTPKISDLFNVLSTIEEPINFKCIVRFFYGKRSNINTIVQLPIKVTSISDAPYNEIHGMHFVKMDGKNMEYEVIIDLSEKGECLETVIFGYRNRVSLSIINNIIKRAREISSNFVSME